LALILLKRRVSYPPSRGAKIARHLLVFKSLKTLSKIFTYGIIKKEILTTKSNLGVDIKIKIK